MFSIEGTISTHQSRFSYKIFVLQIFLSRTRKNYGVSERRRPSNLLGGFTIPRFLIPRKEAKQIKMLSATRACLLMALLGVAVDAAVMPRQLSPLKSGRGSAMRLISKIENDGDDVDQHGDPDAVVVGDDQKTERALSCQQLKNLYLRGGGDAATVLPEGEKLQVVFVSAEIAPWSITGGLGAVSPQNTPCPHDPGCLQMSWRRHRGRGSTVAASMAPLLAWGPHNFCGIPSTMSRGCVSKFWRVACLPPADPRRPAPHSLRDRVNDAGSGITVASYGQLTCPLLPLFELDRFATACPAPWPSSATA